MKFLAMAAAICLSLSIAAGASASVLNFDLTYDGSSVAVNGGSDDPNGAVMNAGDSFNLTLSAANNDFWRVDTAYNNVIFPLVFLVIESASRTVNVTTTFLLDGAIVNTISEPGITEASSHLGPQIWNLSTGLEFDQVVVDLSLTSLNTGGTTTINASGGIFNGFGQPDSPFFTSSKISYNSPAAVPLPAGLPLVLSGLVGLGLISRRRRRS